MFISNKIRFRPQHLINISRSDAIFLNLVWFFQHFDNWPLRLVFVQFVPVEPYKFEYVLSNVPNNSRICMKFLDFQTFELHRKHELNYECCWQCGLRHKSIQKILQVLGKGFDIEATVICIYHTSKYVLHKISTKNDHIKMIFQNNNSDVQ